MKIIFTDLNQAVMTEVGGTLPAKFQKRIDLLLQEGQYSGQALWHALVYEGFKLGIEETQAHISDNVLGMVNMLRGLVTRLEVAQAMTEDDSAINVLGAITEHIRDLLKTRASMLVGLHANIAAETLGVDPEWITGDIEPENLPLPVLATTGHNAYRRMPSYFASWSAGARSGKLSMLRCRCTKCLQACLNLKNNDLTDAMVEEELTMALVHFSGFDAAFAAFGRFLITECREMLYRDMSGLPSLHDEEDGTRGYTKDGNPGAATDEFIRRMMKGKPQPKSPPDEDGPE